MSNIFFADIGSALANSGTARLRRDQRNYLAEDRATEQADAPHVSALLKGDRTALDRVSPQTAMKLAPYLQQMDAGQRTKAKEAADYTARASNAILSAAPAERPAIYQQLISEGKAMGFDLSRLPPQYTPQIDGQLRTYRIMADRFLKEAGNDVILAPPAGGGGTRATAPAEWEPHFQTASQQYGVPVQLIKAVAGEESAFNPKAVSSAGAGGVMQVMPGTAKDLGLTDRFDAGQSINKGTAYLKQQLDKFGNLDHALVAYNWGPGNAEKWVAGGADPAKLPAETRNYIAKVKANLQSQTAQAGPPTAQGDGGPPSSPAGNGQALTTTGTPVSKDIMLKLGDGLQPGQAFGIDPQTRKYKEQNGHLVVYDQRTKLPVGLVPIPKEPGADKGLFGDSLTGRALTALRTLDPSTQDYAAAYAIMSKPQVIFDQQTGKQQVIQPMDLSMFPKPAFGGGGQPTGAPAIPPGAETTQIPGGGTTTTLPGKGKPLDNSARDDLKKIADTALELPMLLKSFDPSFGGYGYSAAGDAANFAKRNLPDGLGGADPKGQAQWWQRYNNFANLERNKLFGSALTPGETAAFNAAMVNTGMKPDQITANLARQSEIAQKALSRIAHSLKASGYSAEAIEALTGTMFSAMPSPQGAVEQAPPKGAGNRPPLESFGR